MTTVRNCTYFASGLSMGIALSLFLAPRSGAEVRNGIRCKLREGAQALRNKKQAAEDAMERETRGISAAIDAGKRAYVATTQHGAEAPVK